MRETLAAALAAIQGSYGMPSAAPPPPLSQGAATTPAPAPASPLPLAVAPIPGKTLGDLPNVTIRFFDVQGRNLKAINKAIVSSQQKDARGQVAAPPTSWAVDTTFRKTTAGGRCRIVSAKATFTANVTLPRLVANRSHSPELLTAWRDYLAGIEKIQAANLWFVYDHMRDVENAILASSCEAAPSAGAAAVQRLQAQAAEFRRANASPAPPAK